MIRLWVGDRMGPNLRGRELKRSDFYVDYFLGDARNPWKCAGSCCFAEVRAVGAIRPRMRVAERIEVGFPSDIAVAAILGYARTRRSKRRRLPVPSLVVIV